MSHPIMVYDLKLKVLPRYTVVIAPCQTFFFARCSLFKMYGDFAERRTSYAVRAPRVEPGGSQPRTFDRHKATIPRAVLGSFVEHTCI